MLLSKPMNRQERGCWFDTEGSLRPGKVGRGGSLLVVTQRVKRPLIDYVRGAALDGVKCRIYYAKSTRMYFVTIHGMENIAKELNFILPFVRTQKKMEQAFRFRHFLSAKRLRHQHQAERALRILEAAQTG